MTVFVLEALDTQFYRGTLPFDAGADGFATTEPLPWPSTVYGAWRTAGMVRGGLITKRKISNFHKIWGNAEKRGSFTLKGPLLWRDRYGTEELLLPMPADLVATCGSEPRLRHLIPHENHLLAACSDLHLADWGLRRLMIKDHTTGSKVESLEDRFLSNQLLENYLTQTLHHFLINEDHFPAAERLFHPEPRIGIKRSQASHQAEEGMLYAAWHHRFLAPVHAQKELAYWMHLYSGEQQSLGLPDQGVLKLGGEGRSARYRKLAENSDLGSLNWTTAHKREVVNLIAQQGKFKLQLLTPGLFDGRAHPFTEANGRISLTIKSTIKATLVGLATYKPVLIGGWDLQKKFPKPLITGMPAGTVYFFSIENFVGSENHKQATAEQIFTTLNFASICTDDIEKEGFGLVLVGGWHV
uniref:Type III-B CRISPR module-associated protein Cmr3 n=1 Tax=Desulfobacca acetoxidans TaxID=60893 RepID=A0A7V4G9L2_9BACT